MQLLQVTSQCNKESVQILLSYSVFYIKCAIEEDLRGRHTALLSNPAAALLSSSTECKINY